MIRCQIMMIISLDSAATCHYLLGKPAVKLKCLCFTDPESSSVSCHSPLAVHHGVWLFLQQSLNTQILQVLIFPHIIFVIQFKSRLPFSQWIPKTPKGLSFPSCVLGGSQSDGSGLQITVGCVVNSCSTCEHLQQSLSLHFKDCRLLSV